MSVVEPVYFRLGPLVSDARRRLGLTQQHLADQVGLTRPSIANIEACRQRIDLATFIRLRDLLAFDQDQVLGRAPQAPAPAFLRPAMDQMRAQLERHVRRETRRILG